MRNIAAFALVVALVVTPSTSEPTVEIFKIVDLVNKIVDHYFPLEEGKRDPTLSELKYKLRVLNNGLVRDGGLQISEQPLEAMMKLKLPDGTPAELAKPIVEKLYPENLRAEKTPKVQNSLTSIDTYLKQANTKFQKSVSLATLVTHPV